MHLFSKTFIRRVLFFSFLIVAFTTTSLLLARRCGCGARASRGRSSGRYGRTRVSRLHSYRSHPRNPTSSSSQSNEDSVCWAILPPFLVVFIFNRWRKFKGYWWPDPYRYCTCPPEDHELKVTDRRVIMVIALILVTAFSMLCWSWEYYLRAIGLAIFVTLLYLGFEYKSMRSKEDELAATDFSARLLGIIFIFVAALDMMYCGLSWKDYLLDKVGIATVVILLYFLGTRRRIN